MCCDYRIFLRYKQRFDKANAKSKDQSVYSGVQHWRLPYRAVHKQSIFKAAQRQKGQTMNYMNNNPIIIGIDHGYGNIKTAHCCFPTGVIISDKEPSKAICLSTTAAITPWAKVTRSLSLTK